MDYIEKFKKYVPAEVLAAYIALDSMLAISGTETMIYLIAGAIIPLIFLAYAIYVRMFQSWIRLAIVTVSVPIWGLISASVRLEQEYGEFGLAKKAMLAFLVLATLVLTLFEPKAGKQAQPAPGAGAATPSEAVE